MRIGPAQQASRRAKTRQTGFTLIELLVSITIGFVVVGAALTAYMGASESSRASAAQARMTEDAQAALNILSQHIRMAGNNPKQPNYTQAQPRNPITNTFSVRGCANTFSNISSAANIAALTCTGTGNASIAVTYEADLFNTIPNVAGTAPTDCIGNTLPAQAMTVNQITSPTTVAPTAVTVYEADNRFYIDSSANVTNPSLYCRGNGGGGAAQPLVDNIESMEITYGTALATGNLTVAGYLTAAQIETDNTVINLPTAEQRWARVVAVRICVVARSDQPVAPSATASEYIGCDGGLVTTPTDRRLRRAYETIVALRNRLQ